MANLAKLARIYPGQVNPDLAEKSGTPIARPGNIIDNSLSIYGKALSNALGPDIFEGVSTFRGIVLTPKFEIPDAANIISNPDQSDKTEFVKVMIPELHLEKPNPFGARNLAEYMDLVNTHYQPYTLLSDAPLKVGSLVHVTFQDANKTVGRVTFVEKGTGFSEFNASTFSESNRQSAAASNNLSNSQYLPPISGINVGTSAAYTSERLQFADAQELLDAYPQLSPELANKIVEVGNNLEPPVDPAWLANVINFETGYTFDASTVNQVGATGLIQFLDSTAQDLGTTTEALAGMSEVEQMKFVEKYFQQKIDENGPIENANDAFMAVFYPPAMGSGPDFSIYDHAARTRGVQFAEAIKSGNRGITTSGQYTTLAFAKSRVQN